MAYGSDDAITTMATNWVDRCVSERSKDPADFIVPRNDESSEISLI